MTEYDTPEAYVRENRETLENVIQNSANDFARAAAWTLLDAGSDGPELEQLERELQALKDRRGQT